MGFGLVLLHDDVKGRAGTSAQRIMRLGVGRDCAVFSSMRRSGTIGGAMPAPVVDELEVEWEQRR